MNISSQGILHADTTSKLGFVMTQDDDWAHIHVKVDPEVKSEWEKYVEEDENTSTLSSLVRQSVQKEVTGAFDVTEEKYEEVYHELSELVNVTSSIDSTLRVLRDENIKHNEFEDGLDSVIRRMEELHGEGVFSDE